MQESDTVVVWPRKGTRPRLGRKKDSGDGTTCEKKRGKTEAEMDCVKEKMKLHVMPVFLYIAKLLSVDT